MPINLDSLSGVIVDCFFSGYDSRMRSQILTLLNDGFYNGRHISRAMDITEAHGGLMREASMRQFFDLVFQLRGGLTYAEQGFHPDVLNEFPAKRLVQVRFDTQEPVKWQIFWPANGGMFHEGEMVALKWNPVWWQISFLNLPIAPFHLGSGYDLEDVDRDEAEDFGLIKPSTRPPALRLEVDLVGLKTRLTAALAKPPP